MASSRAFVSSPVNSPAARIRVLSVIDGLGFAGDESRLLSLGQNLNASRFHHSVLTLNPLAYATPDEFRARRQHYLDAGLQVDDLAEASPERASRMAALPPALYAKTGILRRARRLARLIRKWRVQVIDGHLESAGLVSVLAGRLTGTPSSITLYCGARVGSDMIWPRSTRMALRMASAVLTDSRIRADQMRAFVPRNPQKVSVIPNGIPQPLSQRSPAEMRRLLGLPQDPAVRIIGMVGRLVEYKGHEVLIQAAREVLARAPDTAFLAVGYTRTESYKQSLIRLTQELGIRDRFVIAEYPGSIGDIWSAIDIHVHASLFDSLPISIAEGMSFGKPAVVTSAGGIPEIVQHGITGLVVPPGDPAALAAALLDVLHNPELARRLGAKARERYEQFYRPEIMAREMENFFTGMLRR